MTNAIWISVIGMGLVFLGLVLLWGMMVLLVRLTSSKPLPAATPDEKEAKLSDQADYEEKHKAAAVAVATAMASQAKSLRQVQMRESGGMTPWQVAHRNYSLSQNQSIIRRKV